MPYSTVGHDTLNPQNQRTHSAKAQHLSATRVGRNESADCCGPLGGKAQREATPLCRHRVMQVRQDDTCLSNNGVCLRIDAPDLVHAPQRQDQRLTAVVRRCAADHASVPPLRHQRHAMLGR